MTPEEKKIHKEAGKYRRMTDSQLMDIINNLKMRADQSKTNDKTLLEKIMCIEHEKKIKEVGGLCMDAERCVMCGEIIPEGRQVCVNCAQYIEAQTFGMGNVAHMVVLRRK